MRKIIAALLLLPILLAVSGCGTPTPAERKHDAAVLAGERMTETYIETGRFDLYSLGRYASSPETLTVYIEGDGRAWFNTREPSSDPTPLEPVALQLAMADDSASVAYLARPCQYTDQTRQRNCRAEYWTDARYGEDVVGAMGEALDELKRMAGASRLGLVGFSGGGTVAALLAARRSDVAWLKTVAAPLDTNAFTQHHKVSPLSRSLNPADEARNLSRIPQHHYVGAKDKIVPEGVNTAYMAKLPSHRCATLTVVPDTGHHKGWKTRWTELSRAVPACR